MRRGAFHLSVIQEGKRVLRRRPELAVVPGLQPSLSLACCLVSPSALFSFPDFSESSHVRLLE